MGRFDDEVAWLKGRIKAAQEEIDEIKAGVRYVINGADRTDKHLKRAQEDVARFEKLIAAYENLDANRT